MGVLLWETALVIASQLCRGTAGRRIGWWCRDWLHAAAPRYLRITAVTLSTPQAGLIVNPCAKLRLTSRSRSVTILWSCRSSGCWLLPISRASRLSGTCRMSCIGSLGGSYHSSSGIISTSARPLDELTGCLGRGNWSSIICGRLCIRHCTGCVPLRHRSEPAYSWHQWAVQRFHNFVAHMPGWSVHILEWTGPYEHYSPAGLQLGYRYWKSMDAIFSPCTFQYLVLFLRLETWKWDYWINRYKHLQFFEHSTKLYSRHLSVYIM